MAAHSIGTTLDLVQMMENYVGSRSAAQVDCQWLEDVDLSKPDLWPATSQTSKEQLYPSPHVHNHWFLRRPGEQREWLQWEGVVWSKPPHVYPNHLLSIHVPDEATFQQLQALQSAAKEGLSQAIQREQNQRHVPASIAFPEWIRISFVPLVHLTWYFDPWLFPHAPIVFNRETGEAIDWRILTHGTRITLFMEAPQIGYQRNVQTGQIQQLFFQINIHSIYIHR